MEGEQYYARVRDLGLTFGESFRGIRAVWTGDGEALGRIALPPGLAADAATYHFHPALLDACFHLLGAPLMQDGMDEAYLLIGIDSFRLYRTPGVTLWNHTRIRPRMGSGGETFAGDIRLYDDAGALVAEALGLQLKRADRAALLRAVGRRPADWIYQVVWQPQPLTPAAGTHGPADGWLIFADAAGVGEALASRLRARGNCCLLVEQGTALVEGTDRWQIDPFAPEQFQHLLAKAALPQFGKVVYLWGCASPSGGQPDHIFGGLLHLVQALVQYTAAPASKLWVATCQAQPVLGPPAETGMRQATLWGLGRVAALEHPQLWGGLVDLELEDVQLGAAQLLAEVDAAAAAAADPAEAAGAEDQVAWRGGDRYVPRLLRSPAPPPQSIAVSPGAAYLVTGGLGGLGLQVAHWLAEHGARHLVLIGRRGLPPQVMTAAPDPQFGATLEAIRHIEALGATVTVLAADVASHADMAALFARFGADLPPLGGIVHAAAALSSAPLAALAWPDVAAMLHPKVAGTLVLHELSAGLDLDFFVLFSSTTALLGAQGLAHYAAANAFLDAFAAYRRSLGLPALSINWGTWNVMRAASVTERQRAAEVGLQQMPAEQALALLGDFLAAPPQPQVVIAAVDWAMLKPTYEARRRRPFLAAVGLPAGRPASLQMADPAARAADLPAQTLAIQYQAAHPQDRRDLLIAALRQAVAKVVGLADPRAIDLHQGLFEMGLDSLMSVELKTRLEREVGQALPPTLTFNYPTIHDLATYLEQEILVETKEIQTPPPAARSVPAPEQAPQTGEAEIDELSEDELAGRLLERLRHLH
jgi:NAD(P)-dependent dehydrogenase (short-subunit alcohol dehydrogenase family)/acyl carrier protein